MTALADGLMLVFEHPAKREFLLKFSTATASDPTLARGFERFEKPAP
jgi:hypothetical protein